MRKSLYSGSAFSEKHGFSRVICLVFAISLCSISFELPATQAQTIIRSIDLSKNAPELSFKTYGPSVSFTQKILHNPNRIEISLKKCKISEGLPASVDHDFRPLRNISIFEVPDMVKVVFDFGTNQHPKLIVKQSAQNLLIRFAADDKSKNAFKRCSDGQAAAARQNTESRVGRHNETKPKVSTASHKQPDKNEEIHEVEEFVETNDPFEYKSSSNSWRTPAGGPVNNTGKKRFQSEYEAELKRQFGARRIGQAECIEIESENVCFLFEEVFLKYANPKDIIKTVDCMFNMHCPGTGQGGPGGGTEHVTTRFSEQNMSPRTVIRDGKDKTKTLKPMDDRGYDRIEELGLMPLPEFPRRPYETGVDVKSWRMLRDLDRKDPKLAKILAHSMVWADEKKRVVFLKDTEQRLSQIRKVIASLDRPSLQVLIRSRIVRANKDWSRGLGILWGGRNNQVGLGKPGSKSYWGFGGNQEGYEAGLRGPANRATGKTTSGIDIPSTFAVNLPVAVNNLSNLMGLGIQFGFLKPDYITELDFRLQFGESNGLAKIVSKPEIQVLDGERAIMKNGSVVTLKTSSPNWGAHTELVPVDLKLEVTPTVLYDNRIRMDIDILDNDVSGNLICKECEIVKLYLSREAHTTLVVGDGETCVIGGVMRESEGSRKSGWPILMNIPILGTIFSSDSVYKIADELLVFLTPSIIRAGAQEGVPLGNEPTRFQ